MTGNILFILAIFFKVGFSAITVTNKEYASMPILFHQDNYDQCMLWEDEALYCGFEFVLVPLDAKHVSDTWNIIQNVSSDLWNYRHDHLRHWICVKTTCPNAKKSHENDPVLIRDLTDCYNAKYENLGLKGSIRDMTCEDTNRRYPIDWVDITVATIVILYISLIIYATVYEGLARYQPAEEYKRITSTTKGRVMSSFSLVKNWINLTTVKNTPEMERLRCVQGIRTYSMALVIIEHTSMSFAANPVTNTQWTESMHEMVGAIFLSNAALPMNTFFMMSCFFLSKSLFDSSKNSREIKPKDLLSAFRKRIVRLTPTLIFVTALHATWLRHFGDGPNWNNLLGEEYLRCRENWWTNILFLNTWIRPEKMCLQTTWSVALDSQYFLVALLIIWISKKYENKLWWILGSLLAVVILFTFWENYINGFPAIFLPIPEMTYNYRIVLPNRQFHVQYTSFVANFSGSIFGIGLGYYSYKYKDHRIFTTKFKTFLWYIICYGVVFGTSLIVGHITLTTSIINDKFWSSVLVAIERPIFTLAIVLIIVGMSEGIGWVTRYILEWSPTYILGKLGYTGYLIHISLVWGRAAMTRGPVFISDYVIIITFLGNFAITCVVALMLTLFLELPIIKLYENLGDNEKTETDSKKK